MRRDPSIPLLSGAGPLGHLRELLDEPRDLQRRFNRECGDLGALRFATQHAVVVNSPDGVGELLVEKARSFRKSRFIRAMLYPLTGDGLFTSEGDLWRRQRKLMAPIFHPTHLGPFVPAMIEAASRCVDTWRDREVVDVTRETTRIAMAVAGRTLFDIDTFDDADELGEALSVGLRWASETGSKLSLVAQIELSVGLERLAGRLGDAAGLGPARGLLSRASERLGRPILWPGRRTRELERALAVLDSRVARMIAERRGRTAGRTDLLSRLLDARDEAGGAMSDRQLRDEILTLFIAGHETTATALAWTFHLLGRSPEVLARLEAEVATLGGRPPTQGDLPRLRLCDRVFREALRLYPPVPYYEREALEDVVIAGRTFRRGAYFAVLPWALHHRAEWWPDAERFQPDRFAPELDDARPRYAWIPFGAGPRVCIGNHFASLEGPLVLATIVQRARLVPESSRDIAPDPRTATLRPLGGVPMRVTLRALGAPAAEQQRPA